MSSKKSKSKSEKLSKESSSKSKGKKSYNKNPWSTAKQITIDDILSFHDALEEYNEENKKEQQKLLGYEPVTQSEIMKKFGTKYYNLTIRNTDGKYVLLLGADIPYKTTSRVKQGDEDNETSALSFTTHILTSDKKKLKEMAKTEAEEFNKKQETKLTDEELEEKEKKILARLELEFKQWKVWKIIDAAFIELFSDPEVQQEIEWAPSGKQVIRGFIQYERKYKKDQDDKKYFGKMIPLDQPICRQRLHGHGGELYARIEEIIQGKDGKNKKMPVLVEDKRGKMKPLDYHSVQDWLRVGSIVTGVRRYAACQCGSGMLLHVTYSDIAVKRGARGDKQSAINENTLNGIEAYDGEFESTEDEIKKAQTSRKKSKDKDLLDELNENDSNSDDDPKSKKKGKSHRSESDSDSDDEPKKKNRKPSKKDESDSDSDDEPKKKNRKPSKKDESDSDDDGKRKGKKPSKKDDSDEESD